MAKKEDKISDKDLDGFDDPFIDAPDFGMGALAMPDFSQIGKAFSLLSWLPAIITTVLTFIVAFIVLVLYYGLTQGGYYMTFDSFMWIIMIPFIVAIISGGITRLAFSKKSTGIM